MDTSRILDGLSDIGCGAAEARIIQSLCEEEDRDSLVRLLRKRRSLLMEELRSSQKKVDRMDFLIREIRKEQKTQGGK